MVPDVFPHVFDIALVEIELEQFLPFELQLFTIQLPGPVTFALI